MRNSRQSGRRRKTSSSVPRLRSRQKRRTDTALPRALPSRPQRDSRAEREMRTTAVATDQILERKLEETLDEMAQQFRRTRAQDIGELKGHIASRLELIPKARVTPLSLEEKEEAVDLDRRWQKYQGTKGSHR